MVYNYARMALVCQCIGISLGGDRYGKGFLPRWFDRRARPG